MIVRKAFHGRRGLVFALGVSVLTAALAAGCGGSDAAANKALKTVAVNMYARDNPFFAQVFAGIEYEAKNRGVEVTASWAENNPIQEVNQIQNAISRKPDGLIVSPIDTHAVIPVIKQAYQKGIPVVTITDNIAKEGSKYQLTYAGALYTHTGTLKAKAMVQRMGGNGEIGVIHLIRGLDFTESQWKGAKAVFAKSPGIKIVGEIYAGGAARNLGLAAAENLLSSHPKLKGLYIDNDDLALGAIQAVKQRHISLSKFTIVGSNGTPDALRSVQQGEMAMTIDFCGFAEGQLAITTLYNYVVNGEKPGPVTSQPQITITKKNVSQYVNGKSGCDKP